jgi:KaiC/GvpD/RAD55 family RecA-like ATPase
MTFSTNPKAELALIRAIVTSRANYQAACGLGAGSDIFQPDGPNGTYWRAIAARYDDGVDPMPELLSFDTDGLFNGQPVSKEQTIALVYEVMKAHLLRQLYFAGVYLQQSSKSNQSSINTILDETRQKITDIGRRYIRAKQPRIGNPADALSTSKAWALPLTGLSLIDKWVRLTSGELHLIAGDPGSGKTTLAIAIASAVALENVPVLFITAETDPAEIQLSMLTQIGLDGIDVGFVNRVRFDPTFRIERNIAKVRKLWDTHFQNVPLAIVKVSDGPQEVISAVLALATPHLVLVDHAYAVVSQSERTIKEHREFIMFFAGLLSATQLGNHLTIAFNQYTRAGLSEIVRDANAQYGGSGTRNIASSMLHLRQPRAGDLLTSEKGYKKMLAAWVKVRVMLIEDADGHLIDPLNQDISFWIENRYRRIVDHLYKKEEPLPYG